MLELDSAHGASARFALSDGASIVALLPVHLVKPRRLHGPSVFPGSHCRPDV